MLEDKCSCLEMLGCFDLPWKQVRDLGKQESLKETLIHLFLGG